MRIHSYGYNADWAERRGNVLNVHDFGNGLLADMSNCPRLRENKEVSGHHFTLSSCLLILNQAESYRLSWT